MSYIRSLTVTVNVRLSGDCGAQVASGGVYDAEIAGDELIGVAMTVPLTISWTVFVYSAWEMLIVAAVPSVAVSWVLPVLMCAKIVEGSVGRTGRICSALANSADV